MDIILFLRYALFLLLLVLTGLYALLPMRKKLCFSGKKTGILLGLSLAGILLLLSLAGAALNLREQWPYAMGLIPLFAVLFALTSEKPERKLFCFFNAVMIITNSIVFGELVAAPLELSNTAQVNLPVSSLICLGIALLMGFLFFRALTVQLPYLLAADSINLNWLAATVIPFVISLICFWITPRSAQVVMTGRIRITALVFLLLGPVAFLLIYHALWHIAVNTTETARLREENELMRMEQKRYQELRSYMKETRALRHDFRQHLLVISQYAHSGETEKLTDYIGQFTRTLTDHRGSFAANSAVDAVASHYDRQAEEQQTQIQWNIDLPEKLPLAESDFITIFGNLTENALQAVQLLPQDRRILQVTARMLSDAMLGLTIRNPYEGTIQLDQHGLPRSGRSGHGVGLSSVSAVVHRYHGALTIQTEEQIFSAGVLLYVTPSA